VSNISVRVNGWPMGLLAVGTVMLTSACKVDFTILATLAFTEGQDRVRRYDLPDEPSCFWRTGSL
jgi:hypothetical protein